MHRRPAYWWEQGGRGLERLRPPISDCKLNVIAMQRQYFKLQLNCSINSKHNVGADNIINCIFNQALNNFSMQKLTRPPPCPHPRPPPARPQEITLSPLAGARWWHRSAAAALVGEIVNNTENRDSKAKESIGANATFVGPSSVRFGKIAVTLEEVSRAHIIHQMDWGRSKNKTSNQTKPFKVTLEKVRLSHQMDWRMSREECLRENTYFPIWIAGQRQVNWKSIPSECAQVFWEFSCVTVWMDVNGPRCDISCKEMHFVQIWTFPELLQNISTTNFSAHTGADFLFAAD